jgi:hypothetical protein
LEWRWYMVSISHSYRNIQCCSSVIVNNFISVKREIEKIARLNYCQPII